MVLYYHICYEKLMSSLICLHYGLHTIWKPDLTPVMNLLDWSNYTSKGHLSCECAIVWGLMIHWSSTAEIYTFGKLLNTHKVWSRQDSCTYPCRPIFLNRIPSSSYFNILYLCPINAGFSPYMSISTLYSAFRSC